MSTVLADFLRDKAKRLEAERPTRDERVAEWTGAMEGLLADVERWARESDEAGLLAVERTSHQFNDEDMGPYAVPGLRLALDGRAVELVPVARRVAGTVTVGTEARAVLGRADLKQNGISLYTLFRVEAAGGSGAWVLAHPVWDTARNRRHVVPLTRDEFEQALTSLLA